jgi:hypothetical protein
MRTSAETISLRSAFTDLCRNPYQCLWKRWNWKSAILSSTSRALLFFLVNLRAGFDAAVGAMLAELCFRAATAGFYGALTQAFRSVHPPWAATAAVIVLLPVANHSLEFLIHWLRGTPELIASIAASIALTAISSSFYLYAMRHGAFIVGPHRKTLLSDICLFPGLILSFVVALGRTVVRLFRKRANSRAS